MFLAVTDGDLNAIVGEDERGVCCGEFNGGLYVETKMSMQNSIGRFRFLVHPPDSTTIQRGNRIFRWTMCLGYCRGA